MVLERKNTVSLCFYYSFCDTVGVLDGRRVKLGYSGGCIPAVIYIGQLMRMAVYLQETVSSSAFLVRVNQ